MLKNLRKKLIGNRAFYRSVLMIAVPIIVQNAITNFVSLLDNIMVGQVGTEQMSGVSIANQLMFVFNLCIFGGYSGAGIFTAQFHGKNDPEGIRCTMRVKLILGAFLTVTACLILAIFGEPLINQFLHDGSETGNLQETLDAGLGYLHVMLIGLVPFALAQVYSSTLREVGETMLPMKAGVTAVLVNLCFNWLLIGGNLGFPKLGVVGAAIATVLSRFIECAIVIIWPHRHKENFPFIRGVWKTLRVPKALTFSMIRRGAPLLINEALWSLSVTAVNQCYSMRGLTVIAGLNIASTITNLFNVVHMSLGNAVGIMVGRLLGEGKMREAVDTDRKLIFFGCVVAACVGVVMYFAAPLFPALYNVYDEAKELAVFFIRVCAVMMPIFSFTHASYFTLRCGGKTVITFLFDCVFVCVVVYPIAYVLSHFTLLDIRPMYIICQGLDVFKCLIGFILVKKGIWINNIVGGKMEET